jgi:hypothetical protein
MRWLVLLLILISLSGIGACSLVFPLGQYESLPVDAGPAMDGGDVTRTGDGLLPDGPDAPQSKDGSDCAIPPDADGLDARVPDAAYELDCPFAPCEGGKQCCVTKNPAGGLYCRADNCLGTDFPLSCLSAADCPTAAPVCCAQTDESRYYIAAIRCETAYDCEHQVGGVPLCGTEMTGACPCGRLCTQAKFPNYQQSPLPYRTPIYWCTVPDAGKS